MKVFKKILIFAFFILCFVILAKIDDEESATPQDLIEETKIQSVININSHN